MFGNGFEFFLFFIFKFERVWDDIKRIVFKETNTKHAYFEKEKIILIPSNWPLKVKSDNRLLKFTPKESQYIALEAELQPKVGSIAPQILYIPLKLYIFLDHPIHLKGWLATHRSGSPATPK